MIHPLLPTAYCHLPTLFVAPSLRRFLLQTNPIQPIPTRPKTPLALQNRRFRRIEPKIPDFQTNPLSRESRIHIPHISSLAYSQFMRRLLSQFVLLFLLYLLLVGKIAWPELLAGGLIAAVAVTAREAACRCGGARHLFISTWAVRFIHLPWQVVTDSVRVFAVAARALVQSRGRGQFLHVPFDPGGEDPASAGRRALVVGGLSVTPNAIAVQVEPHKRRLLVHQLAPAPAPGKGDRQWPL